MDPNLTQFFCSIEMWSIWSDMCMHIHFREVNVNLFKVNAITLKISIFTCKSVWHSHCNNKHNRVAMILKILMCLWSISVFTVSVKSDIDSSGVVENNKYPCTYLMVSLSPSQQQEGKLKLHCTLKVYTLLFSRRWDGQSQIWLCVSLDDYQTWHKAYQDIDISFMHSNISWCEQWQWGISHT